MYIVIITQKNNIMKLNSYNFKVARLDNLLSLDDIAKQLGISRQAVHKYEKGIVQPPEDVINKLSKIFNCTTSYLTEGDNDVTVVSEDRITETISKLFDKSADCYAMFHFKNDEVKTEKAVSKKQFIKIIKQYLK
jgi:predicted transcriptional regulator